MIRSVRLLGLDFADLDTAAAATWLAERPADAPFGYVVTPNADHLVRLARDPSLAAVYDGALLRLLDSRVVASVARLIGLRVPAVAPGSDLTAAILARHLHPGERITIIGLRPCWLPALVARCAIPTGGTIDRSQPLPVMAGSGPAIRAPAVAPRRSARCIADEAWMTGLFASWPPLWRPSRGEFALECRHARGGTHAEMAATRAAMTGKLMPVQSFPRCVHAVGSGPAVTGGDSRLDEEPIVRATGLIPPPAHFDPPMGFARDPAAMAAAVAFVLDHPARFVFLAVGSPAQERLAEAIAATGRARGVGLCIGAGLAFLAGAERRAPRWMQMAGLEWLFRLVTNPRRLWRRYLCDSPAVLRLLLRERLARSADAGA